MSARRVGELLERVSGIRLWVVLAAMLALATAAGPRADRATAQSGEAVDLALILAIDCSYSVDRGEYNLQTTGMAEAFRRPEIIEAIKSGPHQRIAVAVVQWSDLAHQAVVVPWHIVSDERSAHLLASKIAVTPRNLAEGGTSITAMMSFGANMLRNLPFQADRLVIDIAADGRNNNGGDPRPMRDAVIAQGITINGLSIPQRGPDPGQVLPALHHRRTGQLRRDRERLRRLLGRHIPQTAARNHRTATVLR